MYDNELRCCFQVLQKLNIQHNIVCNVSLGFSDEEVFNYTASIQSQEVHSVEPASWNKCGRPKNAYIVLRDKRVMCARYRDSDVRFILGKSV